MKRALVLVILALFPVGPAAAADCNQVEAKTAISGLLAASIMRIVSAGPDGLRVQVDHAFWLERSPEEMRAYAATLTCSIVGPGKHISQITFISSRTGQPINAYRLGKIVAP